MKYFLFIFSFIITEVLQAQRNVQATAGATISANVISDVVGIEIKGDINFSDVHSGAASLTLPVSNVLNIIGNENTYSITISKEDVLVKEYNNEKAMKVGSFTINHGKLSDQMFYADVSMSSKQFAGTYTAITPIIVVNYN